MRKSPNKPHYRISWRSGRLTDLDFADDIAVLSDSSAIVQQMTDRHKLNFNGSKVDLCVGDEKTKIMSTGDPPMPSTSIGQRPLECVEDFLYLDSYKSNQANINVDIHAVLCKAAPEDLFQ